MLACTGGACAAFAQTTDAQTDLSATPKSNGVLAYGASADIAGPVVAGEYRGLVTGTSGASLIAGDLNAHVGATGRLTGGLNLGGTHFVLTGTFSNSRIYSTTITTGTGVKIGIALSFTGTGSLTGSISDAGQPLSYSGGPGLNTSAAGGGYRFTISPGELVDSGSAPEGTGYGDMYVRSSGMVSLVGRLPDGTRFATDSALTSGSSIPVYLHIGDSPDTGIAGTLVFQDVPNVSDCNGTIYWAKPAKPNSHFPAGFELATVFRAARFNAVIGDLDHDVASFTASGADLASAVSASVTLAPDGNLYHGYDDKVGLTISRSKDTFFGSFEDPTTHLRHQFDGVILPKTRTGAGIFFSQGLSGTVTIKY